MMTITPELNTSSSTPLYQQLFLSIQEAIVNGNIPPGEKLPSLRSLAKFLNLSLTTIQLAYEQLAVEGYVTSRPQSGYYVNRIRPLTGQINAHETSPKTGHTSFLSSPSDSKGVSLYTDPACFDFAKWKKCANYILTDHSDLLLQEGNPRGEIPLRREISTYIYQSRGVRCHWEQVVVGAGTQQLVSLLCIILKKRGIDLVSFEEPGYLPVRGIFADRGFQSAKVPIDRDGIQIDRLPTNIPSTVYVSPSNQFPTGSIMPVARRYELLDWASANDSVIIEDDYNSELRYSTRPVPSLQGLDSKNLVVYLGSFSSTLFPSIKISYMVLPTPMHHLFEDILSGYTQTCSKTEQLVLADYMKKGFYQTHLKKLRKLYGQKIHAATSAIRRYASDHITIQNSSSGLHMLLELKASQSDSDTQRICQEGASAGLALSPVSRDLAVGQAPLVIFYYTRIPIDKMDSAVKDLAKILQ